MGNMILGTYGYYYPYTNDKGQKAGLQFYNQYINAYYNPGYLTDEMIENALADKPVQFEVPGKGIVTAKVIPYVTKAGKQTRIIQFSKPADKLDDKAIINANLEKIALSYWNTSSNRLDYTGPQKMIASLNIDSRWRTYAYSIYVGDDLCGVVEIYKSGTKTKKIFTHCKVDTENNSCEYLTDDQLNHLRAVAKAKADAINAERERIRKEVEAVQKEVLKWIEDIKNKVWLTSAITKTEFIENVEPIISNVSVASLDSLVEGLATSKNVPQLYSYFENARHQVYLSITSSTYTDPTTIDNVKNSLLRSLKIRYEYEKLNVIRYDLNKQIEDNGLESVVENISIDTALDLGKFKEVQKILNKYKTDTPRYICLHMYQNIIDADTLKTNILNMLKIYYDFYDMPEKDRKAIAKFIAVNKLSEYYDRIKQYDDVVETLIDNSRDPKLTKPILESIAGTSRANILKDKTFYFEKRGRIPTDLAVLKPIELLESLRDIIKPYNQASAVAIISNIELDADESFIFQFYTFADNDGDDSNFDGRRLSNITKIYNRFHPNAKINFNFDHE